jgi:hypothetical protein
MWNCQSCKESIDNEFTACWQCGAERGKTVAVEHKTFVAEPLMANGQSQSQFFANAKVNASGMDVVQALTQRYKDAYRSAYWLIRLGALIKLAAIGLSFIIALSTLAMSTWSFAVPAGVIIGLIICVPIFVMGVLTSGQGQTNLAMLDTAVNTSRHLTKDEVAAILFG